MAVVEGEVEGAEERRNRDSRRFCRSNLLRRVCIVCLFDKELGRDRRLDSRSGQCWLGLWWRGNSGEVYISWVEGVAR